MNVIDLTGDGNFKYPSQFKWKKSDISKSNAGRTRDHRMHKNKGAEKRTLSLGWKQLSKAMVYEILSAFKPEYVWVKYWDPMEGKNVTKEFYTGDMETEVKWWKKGRERYGTLSFDIWWDIKPWWCG